MPKSKLQRGTGICIVAHSAYGALSGGITGQLGGVERQTSMLARWLAGRGHRVTFITWDEGQPEDCVIDGVNVIKVCKRSDGIPGLRFLTPRWTSLNEALSKADAAVYYQNCGEHVTGQVALWAQRHGRKFVFSSAHDFDCDHSCPGVGSLRERLLLRYGLRKADRLIVQTAKQSELLKAGYGLSSTILPMPCPDLSTSDDVPPRFPESDPHVLWVARIAPVKRLEWLLDLAALLPDVTFDVAGMPDREDQYSRDLLIRAADTPNVVVHGRVPRSAMPAFYRRAALLCSTSSAEGFPNTFLEAWSFGKPVVSTFDPDNIIRNCSLGAAAADVRTLAAEIRLFLSDPEAWTETSRRARAYFVSNHSFDSVMKRFEQVFTELLEQQTESGEYIVESDEQSISATTEK